MGMIVVGAIVFLLLMCVRLIVSGITDMTIRKDSKQPTYQYITNVTITDSFNHQGGTADGSVQETSDAERSYQQPYRF